MRSMFWLAALAVAVFSADRLAAQVATPDPDVRGPARRAAGAAAEGLGAPGVENRIENRQERREARREIAEADRWRYRWHNGEWWYYTPGNTWMYYRDNTWSDYDANNWVPRRYSTGYRGPGFETRTYYYDRRGRRMYYNNPRTYYRTPGGAAGANLGAEIGAGVDGAAGAEAGARIGGAIGEGIQPIPNPNPPPNP